MGVTLALIEAVKSGSLYKVQQQIGKAADVNAIDNDGLTALMWASRHGNAALVEILLAHGADVNASVMSH